MKREQGLEIVIKGSPKEKAAVSLKRASSLLQELADIDVKEMPEVTFKRLRKGTLGLHLIGSNEITIDPMQSDIPYCCSHEYIHFVEDRVAMEDDIERRMVLFEAAKILQPPFIEDSRQENLSEETLELNKSVYSMLSEFSTRAVRTTYAQIREVPAYLFCNIFRYYSPLRSKEIPLTNIECAMPKKNLLRDLYEVVVENVDRVKGERGLLADITLASILLHGQSLDSTSLKGERPLFEDDSYHVCNNLGMLLLAFHDFRVDVTLKEQLTTPLAFIENVMKTAEPRYRDKMRKNIGLISRYLDRFHGIKSISLEDLAAKYSSSNWLGRYCGSVLPWNVVNSIIGKTI